MEWLFPIVFDFRAALIVTSLHTGVALNGFAPVVLDPDTQAG
jgi:hypothetical protein